MKIPSNIESLLTVEQEKSMRVFINQYLRDGKTFHFIIDEVRKMIIFHVLNDLEWNQTHASKALKVHRNTINRYLKRESGTTN
jgi:DNA-binding protein Fis